MRNQLSLVVVLVAATGLSSACATKGLVRSSVAEVNNKVDALTRSVNESDEKTRVIDARLSEVDKTAQGAQGSAQKANATATAAVARADSAAGKADALEAASKRVVYTVVLSEAQGNFALGKVTLPEDAKARIDELAAKIIADPQGAFFEIEGHTDSTGTSAYNDELGLKRAETVKRYLYETYQIPLHRISVISYGSGKPVAPNKTRDGRAQNRRVVIKVLT